MYFPNPASLFAHTRLTFLFYNHRVRSLPSKPVSHHPPDGLPTMIVRSDSNGEDLEGFAGAGLYDSVTVAPTVPKIVNYADEWLIWDAPRRTALMVRIPFPKS